MNWLIPTPHPLPGSGRSKKPTTRLARIEAVKSNKEIQFEKCKAIQQALNRNRRVTSRNKIINVIMSGEGYYASEIATEVDLVVDYVRRFLKELEEEGLVTRTDMGSGQSGVWKLKEKL